MRSTELNRRVRLPGELMPKESIPAYIWRWHATFDAITDAILILNLDERVTQCNQAAIQILSLPLNAILGQKWPKLFPGSNVRNHLSPFRRMLKTRRRETSEIILEGRWFRIKIDPLFDIDGALLGGITILSDITDLKNAEHALQLAHRELELKIQDRTRDLQDEIQQRLQAEETLKYRLNFEQLIVDILGDFINCHSEEVNFLINRALEKIGEFAQVDRAAIFLFTAGGAAISSTHEWCAPGIPSLKAELQNLPLDLFPWCRDKVQRQSTSVNIDNLEQLPPEAALDAANISKYGIESLLAVPLKLQGKSIGFIGFINAGGRKYWSQDIVTLLEILSNNFVSALQRKKMEQDLKGNAQRLKAIIDATPIPMNIHRISDKKILYSNQAFAQLLNYDYAKLIGSKMPDLPYYASDLAAIRKKLQKHGYVHSYELQVKSHDGSPKWVILSLQYLELDGEPTLLGVANDINDLKLAQEKLKQISQELARSNAELERFAYEASHDLQAPLSMAVNYLRLLSEGYHNQLDKTALNFISAAEEGVKWMQVLVKDLLAYSKVDSQGKPFKQVECETVLKRTLANLKVTLEARSAVITHDPLPVISADEAQMVLVFQNLIANAVTFNTSKLPKVHITARRKGKEWLVEFKDNGLGIASHNLQEIFKAFTRLPNGNKYQGSGMGLAICKKIVERHGGRIWVESKPGKGSSFWVALPQ